MKNKFYTKVLWVVLCLSISSIFSAIAQNEPNPLSLFEKDEQKMRDDLVGVARHYIGINTGLALPESDFGSSFEKDPASGYAKSGLNLNIEGAYLLFRNVGIAAAAGYMRNPIDVASYLTDSELYNGVSSLGAQFNGNVWENIYAGIGPYISLPEKRLTLDMKFLLGAQYRFATRWESLLQDEAGNLVSTDIRQTKNSLGAMYMLGVSLGVKIPKTNNWRIAAQAGYMGNISRLSETRSISSEGYWSVQQGKYWQNMGAFLLGMVLKYEWGYSQKATLYSR